MHYSCSGYARVVVGPGFVYPTLYIGCSCVVWYDYCIYFEPYHFGFTGCLVVSVFQPEGTGSMGASGLGVASLSCCYTVFHLCCLGGGVPADGGEGGPILAMFSGFFLLRFGVGFFRPGECLVGFVRRSFLVALGAGGGIVAPEQSPTSGICLDGAGRLQCCR